MASIRILEQTPTRLVIADKPRINRLLKSVVIGGVMGAVIIGLGWAVTSSSSYKGSLTTLECFHKEHLTCKMITVDARGVLINQAEITPVERVGIFPVLSSRKVCRGSGEDRECETEEYYKCLIRLHSPQTSLSVPISSLTQETSSLAESCPKQNAFSAQFEQLISGVLKEGYWKEDTRIADVVTTFEQLIFGVLKEGYWEEDTRIGDALTTFKRDIAAYIPAVFLGLPLLWNLLTNRQRIWTFDKLTRTAELQTKKLLGKTTTRRFSTENLVFLSDDLILWEKRGDRFFKIKMLDYQNSDEGELALKAVEPFLSQEFRCYQIGQYIVDKTTDSLAFYELKYSKYDYHGSLVCSIDRRTKKIKSLNRESGLGEIKSLQIVKREERDEDGVSYLYLLSVVTNSGDSFVLPPRCYSLDRTERIGKMIAEFIDVPLLKAWTTANSI
jgi:hypothetical protein